MTHLLTRAFWRYVLDDSRAEADYGPCDPFIRMENPWTGEYIRNPFASAINWLSRASCRWRGHPAGVVWYSHGLEPDMTCNGCGEDLG